MRNIKTKIPISSEIIQLTRDMLLSDNNNITLKDISEVKRFLDIIDFSKYTNTIEDINASDYLNLLLKLTNKSLENNTISKTITIQSMLNESKYKELFKIIYENKNEVSNEDIAYIKKFMSEQVSAAYIFINNEKMIELSTKISSGDYENVSEVVNLYRDFISGSHKELTQFKVKEDDERLDSTLDLSSLSVLASEVVKELSTSGYYLNTGLENLDNAMGGGLKRGTLTLFGAKTSGFKSGLMLNLACSIKLHSKGIETFDKTKKPCVIYLSLENTQTETFKRLISYTTDYTLSQIKEMDPAELAKACSDGLNGDMASEDLQLMLLYKKSKTIDINHIYNVISEYETQGYEVVSLFVDYLSTMNSTRYKSSDMQSNALALADIASELYNLAIGKNIAVVSGYQLNRSAYDSNNKATGIETLKNVGESFKLTTYADNIYTINKSRITILTPNGEKKTTHYIRFDEAKQRSNLTSNKGYFYEVFEPKNSFKLAHSKYYRHKNGDKIDFDKLDNIIQEEEAKKIAEKNNSGNGYYNRNKQFQQMRQNPYINGNNSVQQNNQNTFSGLEDWD